MAQRDVIALGGRVLIVDDDEAFRSVVATQVGRCGAKVLEAPSYDEVPDALAPDADVRMVLLDHPSANIDLRAPVAQIRAACPDAVLVGNSGSDRREEFAAAGVHRFLPKPWRLSDLLTLFRPVGACVGCDHPLPLRIPGSFEEGQRWVCKSCGARYFAVFDETAPQYCWRAVTRIEPQH